MLACYFIYVTKRTEGQILLFGEMLKSPFFASHNPSFEGTWEGPPEIASGDYRTQGLPSPLLHSGLYSKSLPTPPSARLEIILKRGRSSYISGGALSRRSSRFECNHRSHMPRDCGRCAPTAARSPSCGFGFTYLLNAQ